MARSPKLIIAVSLLLMVALAAPAVARQQEDPPEKDPRKTVTNAGPIVPFLEGTDVFFALGQDTVFEANILHHAIAFQNFVDILDLDRQTRLLRSGRRAKNLAFSVSGTPAVRLRMLEAVSRPVRTPSWMPRGNVQLLWARDVQQVVETIERNEEALRSGAATPRSLFANLPQVSIWEAHAIVGHHSNGQDGCTFEDQRRDELDECRSVTPPAVPRQLNTTDGSFSTNFVRVGVNYRRNALDDELWAKREWGGRVDLEYHPKGWMDDDIVEDYGRTRLGVSAVIASREWSWCPKRAEANAGLQFIAGRPEDTSPVAITIQGSCFPTTRGGWGFFVRYYYGQDYYNIRFFNDISRLHLGFTFNQSAFFRFCRGCTQGGGEPVTDRRP